MTEIKNFSTLNTRKDLLEFIRQNKEKESFYQDVLAKIEYEAELRLLQAELVNLQNWIQKTGKKVVNTLKASDYLENKKALE